MKTIINNDEERGKILKKIHKLVDLEENAKKIGSEGEAYAAAQAVHRLLTMYNLSMDEVPLGDGEKSIDIAETEMFSYVSSYGTWKRHLLLIICEYNFCRSLCNTFTKRMCIVGEQQNVAIVRQLYDYLVNAFMRLAKEKWETTVTLYCSNRFVSLPFEIMEKLYGKEKKPVFFKSYFKGVEFGLMEQFESLKPTAEETALMVRHEEAINDFLSKDKFYTGKKIKHKPEQDEIDYDAFYEGRTDGRTICLNRQISTQNS